MHACALSVEIQIPESGSLKSKRTVVRHLLDTARARFRVAAAEVGHQDQWQRAELGFAAVSADPRQIDEVLDKVERFVWSHPEVVVLGAERSWLETG